MASITDYLIKLQSLTQTNLDILNGLNQSFYTKENHLSVGVDGNNYIIPSYIALENKINALQENFNNLIHSPESGEAYFNIDGNSRAIEVKPYTHVPNGVQLKGVDKFDVDVNNIFKDFLTPKPYIKLSLTELPNDITSVLVKKIAPIYPEVQEKFKELINERTYISYSYKDLAKILYQYENGKEYAEYDTTMKMPIRKNIGTATYVIEKIIKDEVDEKLDNIITIKFRNDLPEPYMNKMSYRLFDETIEKPLQSGDFLTTFDGTAKMEILQIQPHSNTLTVKVVNGEYLNLFPCQNINNISNLSKIKFYSPISFDEDKYIKVPLEEDRYIFITIAAINDRMNIQSPWGTGLLIDTYKLTQNGGNSKFDEYYEQNVKNIGDILSELTSLMNSNTLHDIPDIEFNNLIKYSPSLNSNLIKVVRINTHLDNNPTLQKIRELYTSKENIKREIDELDKKILSTTNLLNSTNNAGDAVMSQTYNEQLNSYNKDRNDKISLLNNIINDINTTANNSEVPIENAKYRIRGFFDIKDIEKQLNTKIIGIKVFYRYKNKNLTHGTALSFGDNYIFSDWNELKTPIIYKEPSFNYKYEFNYPNDTSTQNVPSFNQIDIPITQGEIVDIKLKVIYDLGFPFICTTSDWSSILSVEFPQEYLKDLKLQDIVRDNYNELEVNKFTNLLTETGITKHNSDKMIQDGVSFFHKPENIFSGFLTNEQKPISLDSKLKSIDAKINSIYDEIIGNTAEALEISIDNGDIHNIIYPNQVNNITVEAYDVFKKANDRDESQNNNDPSIPESERTSMINTTSLIYNNYTYNIKNKVVTTIMNIVLTNRSDRNIKLYSMFPGARDNSINKLLYTSYKKENYAKGDESGVYLKFNSDTSSQGINIQSANQFLTFRLNNPFNGELYYTNESNWKPDGELSCYDVKYFNYDKYNSSPGLKPEEPDKLAFLYPVVKNKYGLCMNSDLVQSYYEIEAHGQLVIPMAFEYKFKNYIDKSYIDTISRTLSFDLRYSLYTDPINYTCKIIAKSSNSAFDKIASDNQLHFATSVFKPTFI